MFSVYSGNCIGIIPPKPINKSSYTCNSKFYLDPILAMYDEKTVKIGICIASGKEHRLYTLESNGQHNEISLIYSDTEHLLKHHKKGGQSAERFKRIRQNNYKRYVTDICDNIIKYYTTNNKTKFIISKLVIAGPTGLKKEIRDNELVDKYFGDKITRMITTDVIDDLTVHKIIEQLDTEIKNTKNIDIKQLIAFTPDLFVFGIKEVKEMFYENQIKKLYVSENLESGEIEEIINKINSESKIEIIKCNSEIDNYGGIIGELYTKKLIE